MNFKERFKEMCAKTTISDAEREDYINGFLSDIRAYQERVERLIDLAATCPAKIRDKFTVSDNKPIGFNLNCTAIGFYGKESNMFQYKSGIIEYDRNYMGRLISWLENFEEFEKLFLECYNTNK